MHRFLWYGMVIQVKLVKIHYLLHYQHTTHSLLLYQGIIILLSSSIVDFFLFFDSAVNIQIRAPVLTKNQWIASDILVTVEVCGPPVLLNNLLYPWKQGRLTRLWLAKKLMTPQSVWLKIKRCCQWIEIV